MKLRFGIALDHCMFQELGIRVRTPLKLCKTISWFRIFRAFNSVHQLIGQISFHIFYALRCIEYILERLNLKHDYHYATKYQIFLKLALVY